MTPITRHPRMLLSLVCLCAIVVSGIVLYGVLFHPPPVRIGFSAQLTGSGAELGVQERNGVQLAVRDINAAGGIGGRPVELLVRDDLGTPEGAIAADRDLVENRVVAIIGHATSGQTLAGLTVTEPAGVAMISPTTSTAALSGKDDLFFRVLQSLVDRGRGLARHICRDRNVTRLAVLYDTDNAAYAESYRSIFEDAYRGGGGTIVAEVNFSSKALPDFAPLLTAARQSDPDGLLIIAMDSDTALIAQRARIMGWEIPLFTSAWAQTATLIANGGPAVEGMELEQSFPLNSRDPAYLSFRHSFTDAYGSVPAFGAIYGYESLQVLSAALKKTGGSSRGLKNALLSIQDFPGLSDTISFDRFGDVQRPSYLGAVRNGTFVDIARILPGET
jgi:branched-chain amino acid transport system substrate-binding protein